MTNPILPSAESSLAVDNRHRHRYVSLFVSFLVALSAGSNYGFSSYSPQLQERLHLTSTQINIVGVMGNMGVYLSGPIWGRLVDKKGLRIPLLMSAALVLVGYGGLSLSYRGAFSFDSPIVILAIFSLSTGLGNCAAFTAAMNAQAKSWGEDRRGVCTAVVLSGFGLSAFFYSSLSHTLFPGKTEDYLLLLSFGSSFTYVLGFFFVRIMPQDPTLYPSHTRRRSSGVHDLPDGGTVAVSKPPFSRRRTSSDIGGRAWAYTYTDDADEEIEASESDFSNLPDMNPRQQTHNEETQGLLQTEASNEREGHGVTSKKKKKSTIDITGRKLIKKADFIILFLIMTLISGTGLLLINNIGTMTRTIYEYSRTHWGSQNDTMESLSLFAVKDTLMSFDLTAFKDGDVQQLQAHQVSAISIGNALGRIMIGLMSDLIVNLTKKPSYRVCLMLVVCALALISQGLAATPNVVTDLKKLLAISSTTGLMYGTLFGLCPVLTFEWFGLAHFSQNWGIISLSPVLAGNIFNLLFGRIYDSHVPKEGHVHLCPDGEECFRSVFELTTVGAILATILSITIIARRADHPQWLRNYYS